MRTFTVGVLGVGYISRHVHLPVLTSMAGIRVAWLADANAEAARAVGRAYGVPAIDLPASSETLPDCDAVLLAVPVGARRPYLELFAAKGVAAFVEKPFARSVAEHQAFLGLFLPHRIGCGLMRRVYDSTMVVKTIMEQRLLNWPTRIVIREGGRFGTSGADRTYFDDPRAGGGGILLELGCHFLDLATYLLGATRYEIVDQRVLFDGQADRRAEGEVVLFSNPAGAEVPIRVEFVFSWLDPQPNTMEIHFPSAQLAISTRPDSPVVFRGEADEAASSFRIEPTGRGAVTSYQAFFLEWREFLRGLETEEPSMLAASTAITVTAMIEEIYRRARCT
jgi:predicted dehydrogenase